MAVHNMDDPSPSSPSFSDVDVKAEAATGESGSPNNDGEGNGTCTSILDAPIPKVTIMTPRTTTGLTIPNQPSAESTCPSSSTSTTTTTNISPSTTITCATTTTRTRSNSSDKSPSSIIKKGQIIMTNDNDNNAMQQQQSAPPPPPVQVTAAAAAAAAAIPQQRKRRRRKAVRFDTIEIREYPLTIGSQGIPSTGGVPIGISWESNTQTILPLNRYELSKRSSYVSSTIPTTTNPQQQQQPPQQQIHPPQRPHPPRRGKQLMLSSQDRTKVLLNHGIPMRDIFASTKDCQKILKNRKRSISGMNGPSWDKLHLYLEIVQKTIFKLCGLR